MPAAEFPVQACVCLLRPSLYDAAVHAVLLIHPDAAVDWWIYVRCIRSDTASNA